MTNTEIITNSLKARGMTEEQLEKLLTAYNGDLPYHTIPEWSRRGYHVKAEEKALFTCDLWRHTNKPSRAAIQAAQDAGTDAPETSPHFYQKLSYIYSFSQVEKNVPAPDLDTLKARLANLPGLILTVKGEKTVSPIVWLTGDTDAHAEEIKRFGGIWSNKKSAFYIKPGTAAAPADKKSAEPDPDPSQHKKPDSVYLTACPGKRIPGPWSKKSFYTIRRDKGDKVPTAHKADGYTDGVFNYYTIGDKHKIWYAVHPIFGLSVADASSRKDAQALSQERIEQVKKVEENPDATMQKYAAMIQAAEDGDNVTLF